MVEKIFYKKKLLCFNSKQVHTEKKKALTFFTPNDSTQQFGYMKHKKKSY